MADDINRDLRVLFLATSYPRDLSDWRGLFVRHVLFALARSGRLALSVWAPPGEIPPVAEYVASPAETEWLQRLMAAGGIAHLMRQVGVRSALAPITMLRFIAAAYRRNPHVHLYHINWLQCALPLPANRKPALITVLGNDLKLLRLPLMRILLRRVMRRRRVAICPNADWMQQPLQDAFGDLAEVTPVSFGIDPEWYRIERTIPPDQPSRWLVVTRLTRDKLGPLFDWSESHFNGTGRELHLFGPMQEKISIPDWVRYHGPATPEQLARDCFPRAQGLISLSEHAEGRPQIMLEAMASGLPIIASRMPAHATVVHDGETGRLCDSVEGYAAALQELEDPQTNRRFGVAARNRAADEFGTWDDCAERYRKIYRRLLDEAAP